MAVNSFNFTFEDLGNLRNRVNLRNRILFFLFDFIYHFNQIKLKLFRGILLVQKLCFVRCKHYFPAQLSAIFASTTTGTFFK